MKRVALIGVDGFIGSYLYNYLIKSIDSEFLVFGTYYNYKVFKNCFYLDITSFQSIKNYLELEKPDYILLIAGIKDVKLCEKNYSLAFCLNTKPVKYFIKSLNDLSLNTKFIFFSSDYVFDGLSGNYKDTDQQSPCTNYGKTKYLAEEILLNSNIDFKIIRTSAVMGKGGPYFEWLLKNLKNGESFEAYSNVFFTPTPINFLSEMILDIIKNYSQINNKVLHIVGERKMSRLEFALTLKKITLSNSKITPKELDFNNSLFQKDLSLMQSEYIKYKQTKSFDIYIKNLLTY